MKEGPYGSQTRVSALQGHNGGRYQGTSPTRETNEGPNIDPLCGLRPNRIAKKTQHKRQERSEV